MKFKLLSFVFISISFALYSQHFEVPIDYKLDKAEDYKPYEQEVLKCIDFIIGTPKNEQTEKRKEAEIFVFKWISGSPYVHIEIKPEIVNFIRTSPELLMTFMAGWAKFSIETEEYNNKAGGSLAGIEAVIEFYSKNRPLVKKDKNVEKYIKMKKKGTLKQYIEENVL